MEGNRRAQQDQYLNEIQAKGENEHRRNSAASTITAKSARVSVALNQLMPRSKTLWLLISAMTPRATETFKVFNCGTRYGAITGTGSWHPRRRPHRPSEV
jgi:hypothetical protein